MIAIDTNVLVRIFIDDGSSQQSAAARKLASQHDRLFVASVVQIELVWVLKKAFKLSKNQIILVLTELIENHAFQLENTLDFVSALKLYEKNNFDFSDCMILVSSQSQDDKLKLYTFDRKFSKAPGVYQL